MKPCVHTKTINQQNSNKVAAKFAMHCNACELSSNLWLCLSCGNLGCGRRNYDGSGGNGHALEHFEKNKNHSIVVKTGTITPEGGACKYILYYNLPLTAVFCYTCCEDVIDPDIAMHLNVLGINIAEQKKTEKTMTELV